MVALDCAAYVSTAPLDLSAVPADFVCVSFYKMFGFPTGFGALIGMRTRAVCERSSDSAELGGLVGDGRCLFRFHASRSSGMKLCLLLWQLCAVCRRSSDSANLVSMLALGRCVLSSCYTSARREQLWSSFFSSHVIVPFLINFVFSFLPFPALHSAEHQPACPAQAVVLRRRHAGCFGRGHGLPCGSGERG